MYERSRIFSRYRSASFHGRVRVPMLCNRRIARPLVSADRAPWLDHGFNCLSERHRRSVRYNRDTYSSKASLALVFNGNEDQDLAECATTSYSWLNSAKKYLIDFDRTTESSSSETNHSGTNLV